ncbi:hypothetical protein HDU89_000623 [Geranomyces variabilis]|nr:hypothetical protein HDU89_000623 [Geranomyces variabilis]
MVRAPLNSRQSDASSTSAAQEQVLGALAKPERCTPAVLDKLKQLLELPSSKPTATAARLDKLNPTRLTSKYKENACVRQGSRIKRSDTQSSTPSANLEERARALAPFASKVLNQCVGTLSILLASARKSSGCPLSSDPSSASASARKDAAKALSKPTSTASRLASSSRPLSKLLQDRTGRLAESDPIEILAGCVDCVMSALYALEDPNDNHGYELERLACRFVVGLLELSKSSRAIALLTGVHARLWPDFLPASKPSDRGARATLRDLKPRAGQTRPSESRGLLQAPASTEDVGSSRLHMEVVCLVTGLRCWLADNGLGAGGILQQLIMQTSGLYDRCKRLKRADIAAGSQSFDTVFRILYRTSLENRENPYQVLELRLIAMRFFIESPTFTDALFAEQAFKFGLVFEQAITTNSARKYDALMSFYATVLDLALELLERGRKPEPAMCKWCDHYISIIRKSNKSELEARVVQYRNTVFEGCAPQTTGPDVLATVSTALSKIDFVATSMQSQDPGSGLDKVVSSSLDSARASLELLSSLIPQAQKPQDTLDAIYSILARTCGLLWKFTEKLPLEPSDTLSFHHQAWRDILTCVTRFFHALIGSETAMPSNVHARSLIDKVLPAICALTNTLGRLESIANPDDDQSYLKCLQEIPPLCTRYNFSEPLKATSNTLFALGGVHYTKKRWSRARQDFTIACDYLARFLNDGREGQQADTLQLCKRYEYLAVTHSMCGDDQSATEAIDAALKVLALSPNLMLETAGSSLSATAISLINKHVNYQLSESVTQYTTVAAALGWTGDNAPRPLGCMVSECELQLLQAAPATRNSERGSMAVTHLLLCLYDESRHPIRRARVLIEQTRLLRFFKRSSSADDLGEPQPTVLERCQEAVELLKKTTIDSSYGDDELLGPQSENDLATAYSMLGIAFGEKEQFEMKPFTIALKVWKKLLKKVPLYTSTIKITIEAPKARAFFHDMNATYRCIKSLANYFGMLRQSLNQIICLRLLLRLTTLLAADKGVAQMSASLYAEIGLGYVALGYTGQAGVALAQSRALVQGMSSSAHTTAYSELSYAYYLSHIGNRDKSDVIFKSVLPVPSKPASVSADEQFAPNQRALPAYAFFVHSHLAYAKSDLALAIVDSEQCLKLLKWLCKKLKPPTDEVADLTAALQKATISSKSNTPPSKPAHDLASCFSQWQLLQFMLDVYMWLGKLYTARGSVMEAEHFLSEGLALASAVHAHIHRGDFLLLLSEIAYRQDQVEQGNSASHQALDCQAKVIPDISARDAVLAKMSHGNQQLRNKDFEGAVKSLEECEVLLDSAMSQTVIAHLEDTPLLRGSETPREKTIAQSPAVATKPVKKVARRPATTKSAKATMVTPPPLSDEFECFILGDIKVDVFASMAWGLCQLGDLDKAEKKLLTGGDTDQTGLLQKNFAVTAARMKLHKLLTLLRGNTLFQFFSESAFSLPWNVPLYTERGTKLTRAQKTAAELAKTIGNVAHCFEEAFRLVIPSGPSHVLYELCHGITFLNFAKAYLTHGVDARDSKLLALNCLYFLEVAKGLTYRREMVSSLYERTLGGISRPAWPAAFMPETPPDRITAPSSDRILAAAHARDWCSAPAEFFTELSSLLPSTWIVCTISIDLQRDDMLLTRFQHDQEPIIVRLPLQRQALRNADDSGVSCADVLAELQEILDASNATTRDTAAYQTKAEKREWWRARQELDARLCALLEQVEGSWLGAFKGLLSADNVDFAGCEDAFDVFRATVKKIVYGAVAQKSRRAKRPAALDLDARLCKMLLRLGAEPGYDDVEDALFYLMDAYQFSGVGINYDEIDLDGLVDDIRDAHAEFYRAYTELRKTAGEPPRQPTHTILIPDKHLIAFPWESLPTLRQVPVTRLPSIFFLRDILVRDRAEGIAASRVTLDRKSVHYVLNPSGDLAKTEQAFKAMVTECPDWSGIIGKAPTEDDCAEALSSKHLYIYFGHGGGEQYIRNHRIRTLHRCAVALLMGCSSGRLKPVGEFDPMGTPISYLLGGSRAVIANLWDVTDGDIDKFSHRVCAEWGLNGSRGSNGEDEPDSCTIDQAVAKSRDACKLKYLTGAAPVVYGVPVYIR